MADKKISQLTSATTPLVGTEVMPIVQSGATVQTPVSNVITASSGYTPAGTGAVSRSVSSKLQESVSVKDFGAIGDGTTDDTAAIQAAIDYAAPLGKIVFVPAGTYKITSTLVKAQAFYGLNMMGEGYYLTRFSYPTLSSNTPCLRIVGGSGVLCGAKVEGIGFDGNASNTWAIEIRDQCGQLVQLCQFGENLRGVVFNNYNTGGFTEYCHVESCDFTSGCVTAIEYKITSGNDSFNGSGLSGNCTVNSNSTNPVVIVGDQCRPYNAPLSLQLWNPAAMSLIQNNNTGSPSVKNCSWYGRICIESNTNMVTLASGYERTYFAGPVMAISEYWQRGVMRVVHQYQSRNDGSIGAALSPYSVSKLTVTTGTAIDCGFNNMGTFVGIYNSYLVEVTLIGSNYRYTHICNVNLASGVGGSDAIVVLATPQAFNVSGWGASTLSINGSQQLVVTNASGGFSVTAYVGVTPIGAAQVN